MMRSEKRKKRSEAPKAPILNNYFDKTQEIAYPYALDVLLVEAPTGLIFEDIRCAKLKSFIDLRGWRVSSRIFDVISSHKSVESLKLDFVTDLQNDYINTLRGFQTIRSLSLRSSAIKIDANVSNILASLRNIKELDISECHVTITGIEKLSMSLENLTSLISSNCANLDDICMIHIATWIQKFRRLGKIDLSRSLDFSDEGMLAVLSAGGSTLRDISISHCRNLSPLSIAGFRKKMPILQSLCLSDMPLGLSAFYWLTEGCANLKHLDVSCNEAISDAGLQALGGVCKFIEYLNTSKCINLTDVGMCAFFESFDGKLTYLDMSHCPQLTGKTCLALAPKSKWLKTLIMNGLSLITKDSMIPLWQTATQLINFEMSVDLRVTQTNRKSVLSRMADEILVKTGKKSKLVEVRMVGAIQLTDKGVSALVRACPGLTVLDVSFCYAVTDKSLQALSIHCPGLRHLNVSGCAKVTDLGVRDLCIGCIGVVHLDLGGCEGVTDNGVKCIASLRRLEWLCLKNCSMINDAALTHLARCRKLSHLDIRGLDLVTKASLREILEGCPYMIAFTCESCDVSSTDVMEIARNLPLARHVALQCKIEARERPVVEYNRYILHLRELSGQACKIQRLWREALNRVNEHRLAETRRSIFMQNHDRAKVLLKKKDEYNSIVVNYAAFRIQGWFLRWYAVQMAKKKYMRLKKFSSAAIKIQSLFRGHYSRGRSRRLYRRIIKIRSRYQNLSYNYTLRCYSIRLRASLLLLQCVARKIPIRFRFWKLRRGMIVLQCLIREWNMRRNAVAIVLKEAMDDVHLRLRAAVVITRIVRHILVKRGVIRRADYFRKYYEVMRNLHYWHARHIQRTWRGYSARSETIRLRFQPHLRRVSASVIQSVWRGKLTRQVHTTPLQRWREVVKRWRIFVSARPKLILGCHARKIQHIARSYIFHRRRKLAAFVLLRATRMARYLRKRNQAKLDIKIANATRLQMWWRRYLRWKSISYSTNRRDRAARMIQKKFQSYKSIMRHKQSLKGMAADLKDRNIKEKERKLIEKRTQVVTAIRMRNFNRHASKIQRVYREFITERRRYKEALANRDVAVLAAAADMKDLETKTKGSQFATSKIYRKVKSTITRAIFSDRVIQNADQKKRLSNAILRYQSKFLSQQGVVELRITVGDAEDKNFFEIQVNAFQKGHAYFVKCDNDVSGDFGLKIFVWKKIGTGKDLVCDLKLKEKPIKAQAGNYSDYVQDENGRGHKIIWHALLGFELHGDCPYKRDAIGKVIRDFEVALSMDERTVLKDKGFQQELDFSKFGFESTIWALRHEYETRPELYDYNLCTATTWFDQKLFKIAKTFEISEKELFDLRVVFEDMAGSADADSVLADNAFEYMGYVPSALTSLVLASLEQKDTNYLSFTEYVYLIASYCMLGSKELLRLFFGLIDREKNTYIGKDDFSRLVQVLAAGNGRNVMFWENSFDRFKDKKHHMLFLEGFDNFCQKNPNVLWMAQKLQVAMKEYNLGAEYWERKKEQFRLIRHQMGVKPVV